MTDQSPHPGATGAVRWRGAGIKHNQVMSANTRTSPERALSEIRNEEKETQQLFPPADYLMQGYLWG